MSHLFGEEFEIDGFGDARIAASEQESFLFGDHGVSSDCDDGNIAEVRLLTHPCGKGEAVFVAELDVE